MRRRVSEQFGCIWTVWPSTATPRSVLADTSESCSMSTPSTIRNRVEKDEPVAGAKHSTVAGDRDAELRA